MINWDDFKCRCSGIQKLLTTGSECQQITEKQEAELKKLQDKERTAIQEQEMQRLLALKANSGKIVFGLTAIDYLMEVYAWMKESMISVSKESLDVLQMKKGKWVEAASVELLSLVEKQLYKVHKERIENDFLSGEIDTYLGESVYKATNITDIKASWDYPTFLKRIKAPLVVGRKEQLQGYGDITSAGDLFVAESLISAPKEIIDEMKWKVAKKLGLATPEASEMREIWPLWEHSMTFEVIPAHRRLHKKKIEPFTSFEQQKVYDRVKYAREWLWKFDEEHENMNK